MTNFGAGSVPLPPGTVILASAPLDGGQLPPDTTAWLLEPAACA
jgi:alpha-glucosidase